MPPVEAPAHFGLNFTKTVHQKPTPAMAPANTQLPEGYTVVITGAGKGIGAQIARAYAEAHATNIIVMSRTASDLEKLKLELEDSTTNNPRLHVRAFPGDASKLETYMRLKSTIEEEFNGRLDCLVNNAGSIGGVAGFTEKLHQLDPYEHADLIDLNYLGPYYAIQQLIPLLLGPQSRGKQIINITSMGSHVTAGVIAYGISKLAINRLTQHVGETYADEGLVCIALHPGGVKSHSANDVPDFVKASLVDDITLCPAVCVWFSKESRPWASGRFISSKWDMDELESRAEEIVREDKLKFRMQI